VCKLEWWGTRYKEGLCLSSSDINRTMKLNIIEMSTAKSVNSLHIVIEKVLAHVSKESTYRWKRMQLMYALCCFDTMGLLRIMDIHTYIPLTLYP
jgi:hypothetical protein